MKSLRKLLAISLGGLIVLSTPLVWLIISIAVPKFQIYPVFLLTAFTSGFTSLLLLNGVLTMLQHRWASRSLFISASFLFLFFIFMDLTFLGLFMKNLWVGHELSFSTVWSAGVKVFVSNLHPIYLFGFALVLVACAVRKLIPQQVFAADAATSGRRG